jgi:hypothetical protein
MLRQELAKNPTGAYHGVPWRSHEISRIEALSDAVFAFAIMLLIVALEVPETFDALWAKIHGFPCVRYQLCAAVPGVVRATHFLPPVRSAGRPTA